LLIESGILSLEFARSGAARFPPGSSGEKAISLAAGDEHQVAAGDLVLVPAGVPLQLANRSVESVAWLQIQVETPPTICACGEDLTGSETTLLDSQSLDRPIASPATLSIVLSELVPEQATDAPATGAVHLVGAAEAAVSLSTGSDGQLRNDSTAPIPVYIVTLGAPTTT
jgi:hypothetical protein